MGSSLTTSVKSARVRSRTTGTAWVLRVMRGNLLDELNKPYVELARAKGLSEGRLIWKYPVRGRCRVRHLNVDGDGQGDLAGHGGEQRARALTMLAPQITLAALCLLLGLVPQIGYGIIHQALAGSQQGLGVTLAKAPSLPTMGLTGVAGPAGLAILSPLVVAAIVGVQAIEYKQLYPGAGEKLPGETEFRKKPE